MRDEKAHFLPEDILQKGFHNLTSVDPQQLPPKKVYTCAMLKNKLSHLPTDQFLRYCAFFELRIRSKDAWQIMIANKQANIPSKAICWSSVLEYVQVLTLSSVFLLCFAFSKTSINLLYSWLLYLPIPKGVEVWDKEMITDQGQNLHPSK